MGTACLKQLVGITALCAPLAQAAPLYLATPLGNLGGSFGDVRALNDGGAVVGYALTSGSVSNAFIARGGALTSLHPPGAQASRAQSINGAGVVAGQVTRDGVGRAVTFANGMVAELGTLGGASSAAAAINGRGQVAGTAERADGMQRAFRHNPGAALQDLGTLGGANSAGAAINAEGRVAGRADTASGNYHAFVTGEAGLTDLGTLGGSYSEATAINDGAAVAGFSFMSGDASAHAFLALSGTLRDLQTLGGRNSYAYGLNNAGQVVGASEIAGANALHAFFYADGTMQDLNDLVSLEAGWVLNYAADINERGQIAALGCTQFGQCQGYLLTPAGLPQAVPAPGSLLLVGIGLLLLSLRRAADGAALIRPAPTVAATRAR